MIDSHLITSIESAWSSTTASGDRPWSASNPAAGHCDVTALVIRERLGGSLVMADVIRDGEFSEHHYWNVLPDGTEIDLTRSQFDGSETINRTSLLDDEFFVSAGPINESLRRRLELFRSAVASVEG